MLEKLAKINKWLGNNMFFWVLGAVGTGFITAIPKTEFTGRLVVVFFAYMTFVTALESSFVDFVRILKKPWISGWILILMHVVMPFLAWRIGLFFYPDQMYFRMGFLIQSVLPIAVTSLIWNSILGGDMALAIVTVTLDTFLLPFFLPFFFSVVAGKMVHIGYVQMFLELLEMVALPSLLGMFVHELTHNRLAPITRSVGGLSAKIALFLIVMLNAGGIVSELHWDLSLVKLILMLCLLVASGYGLGYLGTLPLRHCKRSTVVSIVYSVGMRNIAFGVVLATAYFPAQVVVPVTLASMLQAPIAAAVALIIKRTDPKRLEV